MRNEYSYHYYNSHALLMVNRAGIIRVLYTPFRVKCLASVGIIPENAVVYVEEIFSNNQDELHYMVLGSVYPYTHFKLLSEF